MPYQNDKKKLLHTWNLQVILLFFISCILPLLFVFCNLLPQMIYF